MVEETEVLAAAGPRLEAQIKQFAEAKGAVVEREPTGGAVVAVEVALAVANTDPVGDQCCEPSAEQARQLHHLLSKGQLWINLALVVARDQVLHDHPQLVHRLGVGVAAGAAGKQLQLAHAQKRWGHAGADRRWVVHQDVGIKGA